MKYWIIPCNISYDVYRVFNKSLSTIDDLEYIINCTNYIDYGTTIN
ncbi:hypothetical protein QI045_10770 [Staphylococcus saprophyticus]|nr:hypothetical protein [Staphylococcus saprophyticus]